MEEILVTINYYIREKLWCSIRNLVDDELRKGQDPVLTFWKSYGIFNEGRVTEAIRELSKVQDRRECQYAATLALIYFHERCRNVDQESIDTLILQQDEREEMAGDKDLLCAATFLWHTQQLKRAGQCIQKVLESNPANLNATAIKGWVYLSTPKEELHQKGFMFFQQVLDEDHGGNRKNLEALLGKAKFFEKNKKYDECLEVLSELCVVNKTFWPAQVEKAKVHISNGEWDQALEALTTVLVKDKSNVEALRIYTYYLLSRENDMELVTEKMDELMLALQQREEKNADLFYNISRLFARYCGRRHEIINKTLQFMDVALSQQPENAVYHTELGTQKSFLGDYTAAVQIFQRATQYDENYLQPLYGIIYCRVRQEQIDDAQQQLEFLTEISESQGKTAEHAFLEAVIEWRKRGNKNEAIRLLDQCLSLHIQQTKTSCNNLDFYIRLNADFLMQLAQEYLLHCGVKPRTSAAGPPNHLRKAIKLLENVNKQSQALTEAQVLLGKARWLNNDTPGALRELNDCLSKNPTAVEAHMQAALINSEAGNMKAADNLLKQAFAQDFSIRENPVFMLMKSEVEIKQQNWEEAKGTLEEVLKLPEVQDPGASTIGGKIGGFSLPFGQEERARVFLNLITVYCEQKDYEKAKRLLTRAISEFAGTPEEVRVMLAQSDLSMKMGDTKKALNMLKKIDPSDRSFVQAKKKQAQIYLDELKDRNNYTRCYLEILDAKSSVENFKMVAQALMDIQEPEEAIMYYERALERQREDVTLVREVGKALVMTHDYSRAIKYYETRLVEDPKLLDLRVDLAELYLKLRGFDDARRVLIDALKYLKGQDQDLNVKTKNVQYLMILAKVNLEQDQAQYSDWKFKDNPDARSALVEASEVQKEVIEMCREVSSERLDDERELSAEISFRIGKYKEERDGNNEEAILAYNDCLTRKEDHKEALISLAHLYQTTGNNDKCMKYCRELLKLDPSNEQATFMQANLMLMKEQTEGAIKTYIQLLEKQPDNFNTLSQLIELLRRAGRTTQALEFIENAEKNCSRTNMPGLAYCKGQYARFTGEPLTALKELNAARQDKFYKNAACVNMIEIYLNPLNEMIYTSLTSGNGTSSGEYTTPPENIEMARALIEELQTQGVDTSILECNTMVCTKQKANLEQASKTLKQMLEKNKDYVPALVTMGLCKFIQKKSSDARNYLKTAVKDNEFQLQFADYFEKAWLLMSDYFISVNKFDLAEAELKKVLKYNRSNVKAEEMMGLIKEKMLAYVDAADHYEKAFKMSQSKNPAVGFRLSFNFLKAKRYVDTINVGKEILKVHPNYPQVQTELIDKARAQLRA